MSAVTLLFVFTLLNRKLPEVGEVRLFSTL